MFPLSSETVLNSTSPADLLRSPFSFTMGPFTIYPLFLLPLMFWISPISSEDLVATARDSSEKEHKLHQVYTQTSSDPNFEDGEEIPFYANQQLNLQNQHSQSPKKDRYYMPPPLSYYPPLYSYQNQMYNYPNSPYSSPLSYPYANVNQYANVNPYLQPSLYPPPQNFQSHLFDPYVMMMHLAQQPTKYQSQVPTMLTQPQQHYQSSQPSPQQFYSNHQQQPKPLDLQGATQMMSPLLSSPHSLMSSLPENSQTLYTSTSTSGEPNSIQSSVSHSQGQQNQNPYQSIAVSSVFNTLGQDTQQLLASLSPPFGYIDKQVRDADSDLMSVNHIASKPPPKAIMTTATDLLGLRAHRPFTYTPDKHKHTVYKHKGQSTYKRKPPVFQFNRYNSNNKQFTFGNRFTPSTPPDYTKKSKNILKSSNSSTEAINLEKECKDCNDEEPEKFISEPIIPGASPSSPSLEMIEAVMAKTKKDAKLAQANKDKEEKQDPIPLFIIGDEDEDSRYFTQTSPLPEDSSFSSFKHQIYRCPSSEDVKELSEAEIYADPLKCDQFYYCKWGRAYVFKCPVNHVFNPFSNICERDLDFACAMSMKK